MNKHYPFTAHIYQRGIPSQLYNCMHSTETCLQHLTQPLWIREVQGATLLNVHSARGTVGLLPCSGAEWQIFTLSVWGFDPATFLLLAQLSYPPGYLFFQWCSSGRAPDLTLINYMQGLFCISQECRIISAALTIPHSVTLMESRGYVVLTSYRSDGVIGS